MKIIFVTQHLTDGGAERGMIAFANALACLGEDVCIAYMEDIGTDYPINPKVQTFLMHHNSKVSIPKLRGLCNILLPIKQLRQLSGDVFILDNLSLKYNWKVLGAASFSRRKVVYAIVNNMGKKQFDKKRKKHVGGRMLSGYKQRGKETFYQNICKKRFSRLGIFWTGNF